MTDKVKSAITKAVQPLIDSGSLDTADGIWYSNDFGEKAPVVRLSKSAPKATRTGGGGGKRYPISTSEMLARHGSETYKEGLTFQQAFESNNDRNWRQSIRNALLKLEGII